MGDILGLIEKNFTAATVSGNYGKALVSDGKISMWVRVKDRKVMREFQRDEGRGFYSRVGVVVRESKSGEYGFELVPVFTGITADYIPGRCRVKLSEIIKNPGYYISTGAGFPPVWFIDVKIENCEGYEVNRDVRD